MVILFQPCSLNPVLVNYYSTVMSFQCINSPFTTSCLMSTQHLQHKVISLDLNTSTLPLLLEVVEFVMFVSEKGTEFVHHCY